MRRVAVIAAALLVAAGAAQAADPRPAFVFDLPAMQDRAFVEGLVAGAHRFTADTHIDVVEFPVTHAEQFEEAYRRLAERGHDPIIALGPTQVVAVARSAAAYPRTRWIAIDGTVDLPNVQSTLFDEGQGSFLVGIAAAMATKSGKIGFVGRDDVPRVARFACGYRQGARYADRKIALVEAMTGSHPSGNRAAELAKQQFEQGIDVVYAVAGSGNLGVYQTAADAEKWVIGVGSGEYFLAPGTMLTSMVERVDRVVYDSLMAAKNGAWKAGVSVWGLKEGGVDWVLDPYGAKLVTDEMKARVDAAKAALVAGKIKIADDRCVS